MNKDELKYIKENYFNVRPHEMKLSLKTIMELIDEVQTAGLLTEAAEQRDITLRLPIIRISEKMWGREGTQDRAIIENLMTNSLNK